MQDEKIYVSELSASKHIFNNSHFCRGNSNRRKTRVGVIIKGSGTYIYLNKKLNVNEGDFVFIPENIYCYSEWHGTPEIEVIYVSCFMHYEQFRYEPQIIYCDKETKNDLIAIANLLSIDYIKELEAYSALNMNIYQKIIEQTKLFSYFPIDRSLIIEELKRIVTGESCDLTYSVRLLSLIVWFDQLCNVYPTIEII